MRRYVSALIAAGLLAAGCSSGQPAAEPERADNETASSQSVSAQPGGAEASSAASSPSPSPTPTPTPTPEPVRELPNGGTELFPTYRLCGYVGQPGAPGQGRLGMGDINERMVELHQACAPYAAEQQIMPVMELIAVTVMPFPGEDGMWRHRTDLAIVDEWLAIARANNAILLLNIQPGQSDFIDEVMYFEKYLSEPDVGVALDPEWAMAPGHIPMQNFGSVTGQELDLVSQYLAGLVETHKLPDKVMLYHILHPHIITEEAALLDRPGVVLIKSVDGIGSPADKIATYNQVAANVPPYVNMGFKLFYEEDVAASGGLMPPEQVLAIVPQPWYVLYE